MVSDTCTDEVAHKGPIETTLDSPRHRSARSGAAEFNPADVVVLEAWARVVPAVESFHLGQFEDGGACVSLVVRDAEATETLALWLIWPEAEQIRVRTIVPRPAQSRHHTLRSALQAVTPVSPGQWHSLVLLAETMLAARTAPHLTRAPGNEPRAAA
jgi:hypothetical protein